MTTFRRHTPQWRWVQLIGSHRQGDVGVVRGKAWGEEQYDIALVDGVVVRVPGADLASIEKQEPLHAVETPADSLLPA